jgi:tetratricopeptide (TPR) repeat protein
VVLPVAACVALLVNRNAPLTAGTVPLSRFLRAGPIAVALLCIAYSAATFLGWSRYEKGMDLLKRGETNLAFAQFSGAKRLDPLKSDYPDALSSVYYRWFLRTRSPEYLAAAVNLEQEAHAASPENPLHLSQTGFLLGELAEAVPGDAQRRTFRDLALAALDDSLRKDPHSIVALLRTAEIRRRAGETAKERVALERLVAAEPNFAKAYLLLAELEATRDPRKAEGYYRKAIAISCAFEKEPLEPEERELLRIDRPSVTERLEKLERGHLPSGPRER